MSCLGNQGNHHQLQELNDLIAVLKGEMEELNVKVKDKEKKLSALVKQAEQYNSDFDKGTHDMIGKIRKVKDAQVLYCNIVVLYLSCTTYLLQLQSNRYPLELPFRDMINTLHKSDNSMYC